MALLLLATYRAPILLANCPISLGAPKADAVQVIGYGKPNLLKKIKGLIQSH